MSEQEYGFEEPNKGDKKDSLNSVGKGLDYTQEKNGEEHAQRSRFGQLMTILEGLYDNNDMIISEISRYSKIGHYDAKSRCEKLIGSGLVTKESGRNEKNLPVLKYTITQEGRKFLESVENFTSFLRKYDLSDMVHYDSGKRK